MPKLSSSLILNKYILHLFGVKDLEALSENLKDSALESYDENNVSLFYHALISRFYSNANLPKELLYEYDQNIFSHTTTISNKRTEPIKWKYFQYLALLFTEIYLDKYFNNREELQNDLNKFLSNQLFNTESNFKDLTDYTLSDSQNDLNKIAYWNATGSGKTLLMHINIEQYKFYLKKHNKIRELNRIIVLTPNEGLSRQHLKEFAISGMQAELFDKQTGSLFQGTNIEIIDIHKLEETSGDKTVAIEAFEGNNLVLVDEGHRGSGGDKWKAKRDRLCETGFSFEYSATFGQAVSALSGTKQKKLVDEYGKATIFDYSYRYFYNDGYGKDYQILNINETWNQGYVDLYLTACLLSFFEQLYTYRENQKEIEAFLIEKPLAIFVGSKVTAVRTEGKKSVSDVIQVLKFIEQFVRNPDESIKNIERILSGRDGLNDKEGHSIFRNSFKYLRDSHKTEAKLYEELLRDIFNTDVIGAYLHLDNLKGQDGEIALRIGSSEPFGVINVGDDAKLLKLCEEEGISTDTKDFSKSLFHDINSKTSTINILIGSKKFSEGWSSWRVSTMGLLNIGRGEGSEIIQLFGRGVRLKGFKFSLKRSSALDHSMKPLFIPEYLPLLETLNIFGIRADYMQQFKEYLEEEGMPAESDYETVMVDVLPTITDLSGKKLKYIKVKDGANFKKETTVTATINGHKPKVILDWYPKVQVLNSSKKRNTTQVVTIETGNLEQHHLAFLDWDEIYFELQRFKNERSWYNLNLSTEDLKGILNNKSWYEIQIPHDRLEFQNVSQINEWQDIAVSLLKLFCERVYNYKKNEYFSDKLEVGIMDTTHGNFFNEYRIAVLKSETTIADKVRQLKEIVRKKDFKQNFIISQNFEAIYFSQHLYQPLFYIENGQYNEVVKLQPNSLNKGERDFVEKLKQYYLSTPEFLQKTELYLLRNISKKGIGFFEANNFYPDFILWLVIGSKQYVSFIDPKGLRQLQGITEPKIELHKSIKNTIQPKVGDPDIILNSFIISNTPYDQIAHWKGQDSIADMNNLHVLFTIEQPNYIDEIMKRITD